MPLSETPEAIAVSEGELVRTDTSFQGRMQWPYLSAPIGGSVPQNGRETGCWIAGHFMGRQMHGEAGLRVQVPEPTVAGVCAILLEYGLIVQRYSSDNGLVTLDVWVDYP